ncbi:MAG: phosphoenolpyruvate mutase [Patescibacteria group bacterium]
MSLVNIIDNQTRVGLLKAKLKEGKCLKIIEVHNGISGLIANDAKVALKDGQKIEFDGFWESSLTDSASKGFPDVEVVTLDSRLETINQILEVTNKPMIVDGDTGGESNQFAYMVKRLERAGVSMVIIEDKVFPKRNSLESGAKQELEKIDIFVEKLKRGLAIKQNPDFMIVARIESLIAGWGIKDALIRAKAYLEAGADGIMIHSKSSEPAEILEFAKNFYQFPEDLIGGKVLVAVPTTYNIITDKELAGAGFNIIIHANHLLRAAYKAMENTCQKILLHNRSFEADSDCVTVKEIFQKVGFLQVKAADQEMAEKSAAQIKVIIPAAGCNELSRKLNQPVSLIDINGKTVLQRQIEALAVAGLKNVVVIRGFKADNFKTENIRYYLNQNFSATHVLTSLFTVESEMNGPFIYLNSDILFNSHIINSLISLDKNSDNDIILAVDNSYEYHKHNIDKKLDLVRTNKARAEEPMRKIFDILDEEVTYIGKKIDKQLAQYEFIGIAYFSKRGMAILKDTYQSLRGHSSSFQEASSLAMASFTDIIQEIVDRGYPVKIFKTYKGWMEIHNEKDIETAQQIYKD